MPSFGALSDVVIILDVDEDWFLNGDAPPENIDFSATVTHEIGHAIGIGHSQKSQALMNARPIQEQYLISKTMIRMRRI